MMATWMIVALHTWDCLFHKGRQHLFQSQTAPKTLELVQRAYFIAKRQPKFLRDVIGPVVWGKGDTPIADALKLMRDQKYTFPATVEMEYEVPKDSDPVKEVKKCVEFCKNVLG